MLTRFSIARLMGFVLVAALGFAALKGANQLWASGCFTLALVALIVAVLNAVQGRGVGRAYWSGFAIAGWACFAAFILSQGLTGATFPPLLTELVFGRLEPLLHPRTSVPTPMPDLQGVGPGLDYDPFDHSPYSHIAQSLSALLAAMLGGLYSAWLWARRERREAEPVAEVSPPSP